MSDTPMTDELVGPKGHAGFQHVDVDALASLCRDLEGDYAIMERQIRDLEAQLAAANAQCNKPHNGAERKCESIHNTQQDQIRQPV